jgi:hypothetical protein
MVINKIEVKQLGGLTVDSTSLVPASEEIYRLGSARYALPERLSCDREHSPSGWDREALRRNPLIPPDLEEGVIEITAYGAESSFAEEGFVHQAIPVMDEIPVDATYDPEGKLVIKREMKGLYVDRMT